MLGSTASREALVRLDIVREEELAEQRQDHLRLPGAHLRKVEAGVRGQDVVQEGLLLVGRHDLVRALREALVARKVLAEHVNELLERPVGVLAQVEELALEDGIILRVRAQLERVPNRFLPRARDLDDAILLLDEAEPDRSAAQVDEHEDEEGDIANIDR